MLRKFTTIGNTPMIKIKYKYTDFKDYYELESKIYSTLVEYL